MKFGNSSISFGKNSVFFRTFSKVVLRFSVWAESLKTVRSLFLFECHVVNTAEQIGVINPLIGNIPVNFKPSLDLNHI